MAFSVASLRATGPIEIADCANVATSFPDFRSLAASISLSVEERPAAPGHAA
jgi:3-phosphoshikimate 1-carboxyvinyltransferase